MSPRRTIQDARKEYEALLPSITDYYANQFRNELTEAEQKAQALAAEHVAREADNLLQLRDSALRTLTDVRDDYDALAATGRDARVSAADYSAQLNVLRRRQADAEELLARAEMEAERLAAIEDDPVAYHDDIAGRTHQLPEWSF
jgi:hypothetical protein